MVNDEKSLLAFLTAKNPVLDVTNSCKGRNTTSCKQIWKEPVRINEWEDFGPDSLAAIYNGRLRQVLGTRIRYSGPADIPRFPFCEIHDEDSLEALLTLWTQQIVSKALVTAQDSLDPPATMGRIYMARGGQAENLKSHPKNDKKKHSYPDWAGVKRRGEFQQMKSKATNILPGDTKISSKWKSSRIERGGRDAYKMRPDSALPIIQVFNYCLKANARYGYIITDQELVVLRVKAGPNEQADSQGLGDSQGSQEIYASEAQRKARASGEVELTSIPWDNYAEKAQGIESQLTINLALWWLHLMAIRKCSIDTTYAKLSEERDLQARISNNLSFSSEIANMNIAPSALPNREDGVTPVGKKRKQGYTSENDGRSTRRK